MGRSSVLLGRMRPPGELEIRVAFYMLESERITRIKLVKLSLHIEQT